MNAEATAFYERHGWVYLPRFFDADEIQAIARYADEVVQMPEMPGAQMLYREPSRLSPERKVIQRIENFCPFHAGFDRLIRKGVLQQTATQLLEEDAVLFKEKINFKMPGGAGFDAHQDQQAGWSAYAPLFLTALVSIDRATLDNGCLQMADTPRLRRLIGREWAPLSAEELSGINLKPVPTAPGDVLFFDSFVPHASDANMSAVQRRILYLTYNRKADGDFRAAYYAAKRANFPPDVERIAGVEYRYRV